MKAAKKAARLTAKQKAWQDMIAKFRLDPRAFKKPGSIQKP